MFILRFWANSILLWSSTSQLERNTVHLWPSHWGSGSTQWLHRTFMLSTQFCVHHYLSLSLSASGSSLSLTPQLPHFSLSGLVCCMCSPLINEPSTWTDEEKLMKPTWHLSKLFPLTYLSFFSFPLCDSFSFFYSEAPVSQGLLSFPLSTVL